MAINFLNNIASIGTLTITKATTDPLLYLYNTTNGSGATIRFSDQTTPSQVGDITYFHSDGSSQGGGASFHFRSEPDTVLVVGSSTNNGRFVSKSAGSAGEVDYGFYDDVDTGMYRAGANIVRLTAGGVQGLSVSSTVVSLAYNGSTKLATTSAGVTVTGEGIFTGNVGIGTTSPDTKLHVEGNVLIDAYNQGEDNGLFFREGFLTIDQPSITVWDMSNAGASPDGLSINSNDGIRFRENGGEVARFKDGNFGIGTTSPLGKLQVNEYTVASQGNQNVHGEVSVFANSGDEFLFLGLKDSAYPNRGWAFNPVANGVNADLQIKEHGSTSVRMTIQASGNVGIGTTSPANKLDVVGTIYSTNIRLGSNTSGEGIIRHYSGSGQGIGITTGALNSSGIGLYVSHGSNSRNVGIGTTSPTAKLHVAGTGLFTGLVSGITPVAAANFVTKAYADAGNARVTPATPSTITSTIVGETIEIAFNQSSTSNIDYYQVWSSDDGGDYGIIAQITPADFSSTMTVVDTTFVTGGTMSYRVFAVREGIYSTAGTTSKAYTVSALSVTDMTVVNLNTAYYIQYEKPTSRFIDHVEIYMDSQTTSAALSRSNATIVYSGQNASYMRNVNTSSNFHQFWVEIVTS